MPSPDSSVLSVLLPSPEQTALLGACLRSGDGAREAWRTWLSRRPGDDEQICRDLAATRTLAPLLAASVVSNGLEVSPSVVAYLRAAALREELRATRFRTIAGDVLAGLNRTPARPLVVRGAALAATVYNDWSLRHCHDLDLLVREHELERATDALRHSGCTPATSLTLPDVHSSATAEHSSGLRVALHTRPFAPVYYAGPDWNDDAGESIDVGGTVACATSAGATLVHVLGHATYSASQRNLRWVADAWHLLTRRRDLDWEEVVDRVESHRLALPVSVLLRYLAGFGMPVAPDALARLTDSARRAGWSAEEVAVSGTLAVMGGDAGRLWKSARSWSSRATLARWAIAPSRTYLRSQHPTTSEWRIPLLYLYRPPRFLACRIVHPRPLRETTLDEPDS